MKHLYLLLFFSIFSTTLLTAQWGNPPEVHATDNHLLLYGNGMGGEVFINDTVSIGNEPYMAPFTWQFVAMFDTASNHLWHKKIGHYNGGYSPSGKMGFTVDNNNSIYIASSVGQAYGYTLVDSMPIDSGMYILKLDEQGNVLNLIQPTQWANAEFHDISLTTDDQNNLYVAGNFGYGIQGNTGTFSFGNLAPLSTTNYQQNFIAKFDENGNPLWLDTISYNTLVSDIKFVNNELYLTSMPNNSGLHYNQFIDKMDTNGNLIKSIDVLSNISEDQVFNQFELASDGYWMSGTFTNADFGDGTLYSRNDPSLYLAKYDFNDSLIYLKLTPSSLNTNYPVVQSLSVNDNDEVFWQFAVPCNCNWTIDGQTAYSHNMIKLNSQGDIDCITEMNRPEISANSTHHYSLNTYLSGGANQASGNFHLGKWNNNCYKEWENYYIWHVFAGATTDIKSNTFQIFPNPATNQLFLKTERTDIQELQYQILSVSGQLIQSGITYPTENQRITLEGFANGVYFLRLQSDDAIETLKFVKY